MSLWIPRTLSHTSRFHLIQNNGIIATARDLAGARTSESVLSKLANKRYAASAVAIFRLEIGSVVFLPVG